MSKIVQLTPCSGWSYIAYDEGRVITHSVAAWALMDSGEVVGLIPVTGIGHVSNRPCLVPVPKQGGRYIENDKLKAEISKLGY